MYISRWSLHLSIYRFKHVHQYMEARFLFRVVSGGFGTLQDVVRAAGGGPEAKFPPMANIDVGASPETRWGPSVLRFLLFSTLTIYMSAARRPLSHLSIGLFCAIGFSILADRRPILAPKGGPGAKSSRSKNTDLRPRGIRRVLPRFARFCDDANFRFYPTFTRISRMTLVASKLPQIIP